MCTNSSTPPTITLQPNSTISNITAVPFLIDNQQPNNNETVKIFTVTDTKRHLYIYDWTEQQYQVSTFGSILNNWHNSDTDDEDSAWNTFYPIEKHFASTIDLNNDCFDDMMIVSKHLNQDDNITSYYLEVYEKQTNNKYTQKEIIPLQNDMKQKNVKKGQAAGQEDQDSDQTKVSITLPRQIQSLIWVTFSDVDNNGAVDLLFTYKIDNRTRMTVLKNDKTPGSICEKFDHGPFPFFDFDFFDLPELVLGEQQSEANSDSQGSDQQSTDTTESYLLTQQSVPHISDVNADGLPDLLMLMNFKGYTKVSLYINLDGLRFRRYSDQWQAYDVTNPIQALFYDYGDDGKMDLLLISTQTKTISDDSTNNNTTQIPRRTSIINNLQADTLYLKIVPLISMSGSSQNSVVSTFGITSQWLLTDIDGNKLVRVSNQKFQQNYGSMQLPFAYSGLGRTNNYIEDLTVGYQPMGWKKSWTPIIPNSQLIVYGGNDGWSLETLLKNTQRVNAVIYVSVMILIIMGCVIFYYNYKEAQQDKRDHYNFIQLIR